MGAPGERGGAGSRPARPAEGTAARPGRRSPGAVGRQEAGGALRCYSLSSGNWSSSAILNEPRRFFKGCPPRCIVGRRLSLRGRFECGARCPRRRAAAAAAGSGGWAPPAAAGEGVQPGGPGAAPPALAPALPHAPGPAAGRREAEEAAPPGPAPERAGRARGPPGSPGLAAALRLRRGGDEGVERTRGRGGQRRGGRAAPVGRPALFRRARPSPPRGACGRARAGSPPWASRLAAGQPLCLPQDLAAGGEGTAGPAPGVSGGAAGPLPQAAREHRCQLVPLRERWHRP